MEEAVIRHLAEQIYQAEMTHTPIPAFTENGYPDMSYEDAYRIQLAAVALKQAAGQRVVGKKIGLTNLAVQAYRGIHEPDYGHITDGVLAGQDRPITPAQLTGVPNIECELAFVLKHDLSGPGVTAGQVLACTLGVLPAIEVVERRFWPLCKSVKDSICDNAACGKVVLGSKLTDVMGLDFRTVGVVVEKNGLPIDTACSSTVYGNPVESVAWLANKLAEYGVSLRAGEIILSGSITMMHEAAPGECIYAHFGNGIGTVKVCFAKENKEGA